MISIDDIIMRTACAVYCKKKRVKRRVTTTHCQNDGNMLYSSHGAIVLQGGLTFIRKRMGVVHMKNKFSFNDLMQFGIFLLALLTFIYMIR